MNKGEHADKEEIIEYPENYEEMVKKLQEREDEQLQKALTKQKANSEEELRKIAINAIEKRQLRTSKNYKPLKDRNILTEPKSEDVAQLKDSLKKETSGLANQILKQLQEKSSNLQEELKGRIKPGLSQ
ncbi:MAG: hypothetical protein R3E91_05940 [Chlamydiales bacterium]